MGVVSPIGISIEEFSENLQKGISGKSSIKSFDNSKYKFPQVFEVKEFNPRKEGTHLLDPFIQYAVAASREAIEKAQIKLSDIDPFRVGISVSSSKGGIHTIDRFKERFQRNRSAILGARLYTSAMPNFAAQWIARRFKIQGPAKCYVAACATGTIAIAKGMQMVAEGDVDYCIAGAGDASITPLMLAGYKNMKAMAKKDIRPYDKRRDGFLIGEGAGIVFLESLESAKKRNVKIYGEIIASVSGQNATDAFLFNEKEHALAYSLKELFKRANISPSEVDYINAHGTGTKHGDIYETKEIKEALGKKAYESSISSIKGMTGHMLGASGAVEIIASLIAMDKSFVPPTIGLEEKDKECDLNYTPFSAQEKNINTAISISMGFGGHVEVVAMRKI